MSCEGPGDYVSDTPQQAKQSETCEPSDSCTGLPGGDPYSKFMIFQHFNVDADDLDSQLHGLLSRRLPLRVHHRPDQAYA